MWGGVGIEAPRALTGACFLAYTCRPMEVLMIRAWRYSTALLLLACNNGTDDKSTEETDAEDTEVEVIEREPIVGDFTCLTPSADYDAITWLTQSIDPLLVLPVTVDGQVNDFQDDEDPARGETTVSLWYDDNPSGTPDASAQTDNTEENLGELEIDALSCQPTAYLALRNPALEDAKPTYKAHQVYGYQESGDFDAEFISVSTNTYLLCRRSSASRPTRPSRSSPAPRSTAPARPTPCRTSRPARSRTSRWSCATSTATRSPASTCGTSSRSSRIATSSTPRPTACGRRSTCRLAPSGWRCGA
jgi:hypothetical protein